MHDVIRDDEPDAGRGERDVHVSRTRQVQEALPAQEESVPTRFQAPGFPAESRQDAIPPVRRSDAVLCAEQMCVYWIITLLFFFFFLVECNNLRFAERARTVTTLAHAPNSHFTNGACYVTCM